MVPMRLVSPVPYTCPVYQGCQVPQIQDNNVEILDMDQVVVAVVEIALSAVLEVALLLAVEVDSSLVDSNLVDSILVGNTSLV